MTPARPAAARGSGPGTPLLVLFVAAVAVGAGALVWLVGPGRAPAHPYALQESRSQPVTQPVPQPVPQPQSFESGSTDVVSAAPTPAAPTPAAPIPSDAAQQAAMAAASLAGSDAAQITADGIALTSGDLASPDPGIAPPAAASGPATARAVPVLPMARAAAGWAPPLAAPTAAADLVGPAPAADSTGSLQAMAQAQMLAYGYGADQWGCLDAVITRESGWHVLATNIRSGAYGLPQALPATKMATAGADWQTNPRTQLAWMLDYVHRRYTDPCGAWAHELSSGWY